MEKDKPERLAKVMARSGLCSRRQAEQLILEKKVKVDGVVIESPALNVLRTAKISIEGQPLPTLQATRLWRYYKKKGCITSHKDPQGRPTLFDQLPPALGRHVLSVGRLDFNTEGLILLTNDGEFSRLLEHPSTGLERCYRVRAFGALSQEKLDRLKKGVVIDKVHYKGIKAQLENTQGSNHWVSMTLKEGKNREIRKVMEFLGCQVTRLIRISYGPFILGDLKQGTLEEVSTSMMKSLKKELERKKEKSELPLLRK
jgi:23S rRNA pseudouridine2605 synthase